MIVPNMWMVIEFGAFFGFMAAMGYVLILVLLTAELAVILPTITHEVWRRPFFYHYYFIISIGLK